MKQDKQILVVEDDPAIQDILLDFLTDEGFSVTCEGTAGRGLELLENRRFDLILLDLGLPDMSGNEFLKEIPDNAASTPVIVVSANTRQLNSNPHVQAVVDKPFDLDILLSTVQKHL